MADSVQEREVAPTFAFHHVGIAVENVEASRRLYADSLGFTNVKAVVEVETQHVRTCFIEASTGAYFELVQPTGGDSPIREQRGPYHLCFAVDDLDAALRYLRKRGFIVLSRFTQSAMGMARWAYLMAPDRLIVELGERADGPAEAQPDVARRQPA